MERTMSRTDKDRPYWVKVNDEGTVVHYHHSGWNSRRSRRSFKKVFDDEGNPVMETREVKLTAKRVIETVPRLKAVPYTKEVPRWDSRSQSFYYTEWAGISAKIANPIYSEAERLIALGMPDAMVTIRIDTVQKMEEVWPEPAEYCDLDLSPGNRRPWRNSCGKELPYWKAGYSCRCSWCKPGDEPRQRTRQRNMLHNMRKAANSGEDGWEDSFDEVSLTKPDMHHRGWC